LARVGKTPAELHFLSSPLDFFCEAEPAAFKIASQGIAKTILHHSTPSTTENTN
jgi:hypothetical protein